MTIKLRGEGIWITGPFEYIEEDLITGKKEKKLWGDEEVKFQMYDIDQPKLGEFTRQCSTREIVGGQLVRSRDDITLGWLIFNEVAHNWEGIVDEDGKPRPCNEENKRELFNQYQDGIEAVMNAWREAKQSQNENLEKNSLTSSISESTTPQKTVAIAGSGEKQTG